jgi:hypothetical protein
MRRTHYFHYPDPNPPGPPGTHRGAGGPRSVSSHLNNFFGLEGKSLLGEDSEGKEPWWSILVCCALCAHMIVLSTSEFRLYYSLGPFMNLYNAMCIVFSLFFFLFVRWREVESVICVSDQPKSGSVGRVGPGSILSLMGRSVEE